MDIQALRELWKKFGSSGTIIEAEVGPNGKKPYGIYYLMGLYDMKFCEIPKGMQAKFQENYPNPPFVSLAHKHINGSNAMERLDIMVSQFFITRAFERTEADERTGSGIVEVAHSNQFGEEETAVGYLDGKRDKVALDSPQGIRLFGTRNEGGFENPFVIYKPTRVTELKSIHI